MKIFFLTFFCGVLLVGFFNLYVDPTNRWHGAKWGYNLKQNWNRDEVFITPEDFDERKYVLSHLKVVSKPDVLLLGSSRAALVNSQMFNKTFSVFNAEVSGASVQDYVATWQFLKNNNKLPRYIILYLDPWVFNKNNDQQRWLTNLDLYEQFTGDRFSTRTNLILFLKKTKKLVLEISDLFTWSVLKQSLLTLSEGKEISRFSIVKSNKLSPEMRGKNFDGSRIYPPAVVAVPSLEEIHTKVLSVTGCIYSLCNWEFDEKAYQDLKSLLKDIYDHEIKTLIILPPYQHLALKRMLESE